MSVLEKNYKGFTLVELMCVVAILGLLASIMAFYVRGNDDLQARESLRADLLSLMQTQRTRASSMGVAAYIRIAAAEIGSNSNTMYIEPRLGETSACIGSLTAQRPIFYENINSTDNNGETNGNIVRIDVAHKDSTSCTSSSGSGSSSRRNCRTLEAVQDSKYAGTGQGHVKLEFQLMSTETDVNNKAVADGVLTICFQPNGQVFFMDGANSKNWRDDILQANIRITAVGEDAGNATNVSVTNMGMVFGDEGVGV